MDRRSFISGNTKLVGIIGDPVAHSRSPAMHNAAFGAVGLDWVYVPFHVRPSELRRAVQAVRALDLMGLNVTVPHKEKVSRFLDGVTPRARAIGAVNTIYRNRSRVLGDNTDGIGFVTALEQAGHSPLGMRVVLIGAGGSARAVTSGLVDARARRILVVNRTRGRARALARHFDGRRTRVAAAGLESLVDPACVGDVDLIVNATSIGLHGEPFPRLAYDATLSTCLFYDLIYGTVTDFLRRAAAAQRPQLDGLAMLLHQGATAFHLWTGLDAPLDVMARALRTKQLVSSKSKPGRGHRGISVDRLLV